jgi:hypothetical protein
MIKGIIFDMVGPLLHKNLEYVFDDVVETAENMRSVLKKDEDRILIGYDSMMWLKNNDKRSF